MVIEHPRANGYELIKPEKPLETTPSLYRLALQVPASKTVILPVVERARVQNTIAIGNISTQDLELYVSRKMLSPEMEKALAAKFDPASVAAVKVSDKGLNSDLHASAEYRAHLITVMAKRAVEAAMK